MYDPVHSLKPHTDALVHTHELYLYLYIHGRHLVLTKHGADLLWVSGKTNFAQYIERKHGGEVLQKKYLHVIRKVLLCQWLLAPSTSESWPPPLLIAELVKATSELADARAPDGGLRCAHPQQHSLTPSCC